MGELALLDEPGVLRPPGVDSVVPVLGEFCCMDEVRVGVVAIK